MMKSTRDVLEELDLSFLSSDEEMAIRQVLQRDENLKRQESGRIRRLRLSIPDPKKLKILTGEWFEELRTRRYGRQSDVTEVVRSSMRRKKTPVPRGSPYRDTRKTDFKGEDVKTDSQTKTSEFKTLNSSFLNPAFREEKVELELTEEGSAADSDVTTVDIPEKKTPPFQKACEQTSRMGISPNPPLSTHHPDIDYFHTAYPDRPSPKPRTIKRSSFPVEAVAPKSQSTVTTQSDPSPPPKPGPEPLDDITYLESARILVLPPEIKDDPEQRSPTVSVDPNTWTQPVIEDPFIDVKVTDKSPEKTPTVGTLPGIGIQGRLEQRLGATMGERITSERITSESLSGDDTERSAERSEERPNAGRGVRGADHIKLTSKAPPVEGAVQAGRHHLDEVPSEPYNMMDVSKQSIKDPKPEEDQSYSESCLRSLRSSSEYNPFCTKEAPIPVEGPQQPAQEIAQVSVELKTWKQVDGDFMQVNLADEEQTPAKTPEGVTLPSANTQGMSDEQFSFDVVRAEFPSPSVGIWERSSRIRPQSKKETFLIGERVTAVSPPAGGMGNRPERLGSRSDEECSDHSLTKLSSRTPPIGGSKQADPANLEEVLSFDPKIGGDIHPIAEDLRSPKPEETQNDSELTFSLLQSTPAYNPFFTTDEPIFVRSPQLSIGEEPQSMKPMDQPSFTDDSHVTGEVKHKMTALSSPVSPPAVIPSVNEEVELSIPPADISGMDKDEAVKNLNKDLDPDPEVVGDGHDPENNQRAFAEVLDVRKLEHDQIPQGMSEQQLVVENSEFQFVPTPSVGMWEGSSRMKPWLKQDNVTEETVSTKTPSVGETQTRSVEKLNTERDVECSAGTKSSSTTPPAEGGKPAGQHHLEEVPSEPYNLRSPKPEETQNDSELSSSLLQSTPAYNPFFTTDEPIFVRSPQLSIGEEPHSMKPMDQPSFTDDSHVTGEVKHKMTALSSPVSPPAVVPSVNEEAELSIPPADISGMDKDEAVKNPNKDLDPDPEVVGDGHDPENNQTVFPEVLDVRKLEHVEIPVQVEIEESTEILKEVTLPSHMSQGMSEQQLVVENSEFQFVPTPSVGMWEGNSRMKPWLKQDNVTEETVSTKTPSVGETQTRSVEKLNTERDVECSAGTKSSSTTPPAEGGKPAGQHHLEEVPSEPYNLRSPKPEETQNDSELSSSLLQSTPAYNPFFTTDEPIFVRSPQLSIGEEPQSMKPMDQEVKYKMTALSSPVSPPAVVPSVNEEAELSIPPADISGMDKDEAVNNPNKDLDPDPEVVGDGHDPENNQRAFAEVLDVRTLEHVEIPVQVEIEESPESQTGAIVTAPIAVNAQEMEGPKEEATSENEMFFIADSIADAVAKSSKVPAEVSTQQANQQAGKYPIPTILVNSSQSPITEEVIGLGHKRKVLEVSSMSGSLLGNLEDDNMESDDDHSSVSSRGSDFSDRRGYGSTLSLSGRTGSMLSVYSDAGDFGNVTVQGAVEFALKYSEEGEFIVTVEQCLDLAFANARKQRTDPYVKTYLHPDKSHSSKKKTSIKKRTTNPVYGGETLKYKIKMEELRGRTLNLSVWHNDSLGRNVFLGQVEINLNTWDWGHEALTWYNLQPKSPEGQEVTEHHGLLTVALKYLPPGSAGLARPDSGEIHVWLKEARELRRLKAQGVDSFVKCYMLPDTSKKSRQKTRVIKKTQEPVYNHAMVYDGFRDNEVREACCELTVWDQNKLSNQFLGGVRLSLGTGQSYGKKVDWMDSWDQEIELWEKMLASPTSWVEGEIPLRSAMTPRKKRLLS